MRINSWLLIGLFMVGSVWAKPPVIVLPDADMSLTVWNQAELLEDPTRQLTLHDLGQPSVAERFTPTKGNSTQLGFSQSDFWLHFRLQTSALADRSWVLHNDHLFVDRLTFYLLDEESGTVVTQQWGQGIPSSRWSVLYSEGSFRLNLKPGRTYSVWLRMSGNDSKVFRPMVWETHTFYRETQRRTWIHALYLGTLLFTIVFQLIFFVVTRERNFILYVLYLVGFLFVQIHVGNGLIGDVYLWPDNIWLKQNGLLIAAPLCISFGMFFFANGLKLQTHAPWLFRLLQLDGIAALLLTAWVIFVPQETTNSTQHVLVIALTSNVLVLLACAVSWYKGYKPARYYLMATLSFLAGILTAFLWHKGLVPANSLTNYSIDIGSLFEVVFFTLGLADDYRRTHRQERNTQQQLIETLQIQNQQISSALLRGQTLERQRVAADLHDNLGSTLSSLRWSLEAIDKTQLTASEQAVYATISQQVGQAYTDVRLLSHNLLPDELAKQGLPTALCLLVEKLNRNTPLHVSLTTPETFPRLDRQTEFELYSICLELLNNTLKHASATEAVILLNQSNGTIQLQVSDNGLGISNLRREGKGLQNVSARIESVEGTWAVESEPGRGVMNLISVLSA